MSVYVLTNVVVPYLEPGLVPAFLLSLKLGANSGFMLKLEQNMDLKIIKLLFQLFPSVKLLGVKLSDSNCSYEIRWEMFREILCDLIWGKGRKYNDIFEMCAHLQELDISGTEVENLESLGGCKKLRKLWMNGCVKVKDLGPLSKCGELRVLNIARCVKVKDLGPLNKCGEICELNVSGCVSVCELGPIVGCTKLRKLDVRGCERIKDFENLGGCRELRELWLGLGFEGMGWGNLKECVRLRILSMKGADCDNLNICMERDLRMLDVGGCVRVRNLEPLINCVKLFALNIEGCVEICDLEPLRNCVKLRMLNMERCVGICDLEPLVNCVKLRRLNMRGCVGIRSVEPLINCTKLRVLDMAHCVGVEVEPLSLCTRLHKLNVFGCENVNLASLLVLRHLKNVKVWGKDDVDWDYSEDNLNLVEWKCALDRRAGVFANFIRPMCFACFVAINDKSDRLYNYFVSHWVLIALNIVYVIIYALIRF